MPILSKKFLRIALLASLVLHVCAAYFSVGFNWFDEYYQIVEFASYKLGRTPVGSLFWEFGSHVRPWLEPSLVFAISKAENFLGITSPSAWLFSFQLFAAVLGWLSLVALADCVRRWIKDPRWAGWAVVSLCVFWFFPWFHARTSGENFSSSVFFIGLWLWVTQEERGWTPWLLDLVAGIAWGLAFQFRNQVAAMIIGGGLWLLKEKKLRFLPAAAGFFLAVALCFGLDRWGYGTWTLSWWNYLKVCVFEHRAASFGTSPWWEYFRLMWIQAPPLLGAVCVAISVAFWILLPGHLLSWIGLPFVLMHFGLGHKELRYLYPIAPMVPLLPWIIASDPVSLKFRATGAAKRIYAPAALFLLTWNVPFLLYGSFTAEKNSFQFLQYAAGKFQSGLELYSTVPDPFEDIATLHFLRPAQYQFHSLSNGKELAGEIQRSDHGLYFFYNSNRIPGDLSAVLENCEPKYQTFGPVFRHVDVNGWLERAADWQLYWCPKHD